MAWVGVITDSGEALLNSMNAITFTSVQTGDTVSTGSLETKTALENPVSTGSLSMSIEGNGARIRMKIAPIDNAYTMRQIGLFARTGSNTPVLFAIMQDADGIAIPSAGDFPDFVYNMSTFISSSNASQFTVQIDEDSYVTQAEFNEALGNVVQLDRAFSVSTNSVSVSLTENRKTYIVHSSGTQGESGGIMDASNGALIIVSNGKYAVLHKGTNVSIAVSGSNLVVTCSASVPMAVIEI